jgi:hypothetical protein
MTTHASYRAGVYAAAAVLALAMVIAVCVVFYSSANNLVPADVNSSLDVFLRRRPCAKSGGAPAATADGASRMAAAEKSPETARTRSTFASCWHATRQSAVSRGSPAQEEAQA